jgi:hypothetical protein
MMLHRFESWFLSWPDIVKLIGKIESQIMNTCSVETKWLLSSLLLFRESYRV